MSIKKQDIESELSYAYLHAVAAKAGFACQVSDRLSDNHGIDATVRVLEKISANSVLTDFTIDVLLKATIIELPGIDGRFSYSIKVDQYNKLRSQSAANQKILVVYRLPVDANEWLSLSKDQLIMKKCAYWVSLRGAPEVTGQESTTVRVPCVNVFSPDAFREIAKTRSLEEYLTYEN
jgi:hypothetical protein